MDSKKRLSPGPGTSPIRRRRFILVIAAFLCFIYFFGSPFRLPATLRNASGVSRAKIVHLVKGSKSQTAVKVDEIYGLLNLVTGDSEHEHILGHTESFDPTKPVDMALYAAGKEDLDWKERVEELNTRYPVVVFSKSYCPYSKRAKDLLAAYDVSPPPKIIEVDLRDDAIQVKTVLTRLTHHATFPNVIIRGKSIGGSDQLHALHANRSLRRTLEKAGMTVRGDIS
ncbi:glutaredoxin domain protein [Favolaschia claudopus]|uniref:Glutaredoxin domain protein n=1 Tax=Favolaschia claudopus TaxID=2862362 RepID=A0AAW0AAZ0_9AGAR